MEHSLIISTLLTALREGIKYVPLVLAASVLFRLAHFPDIGIEGTFLLGACSVALIDRLCWPYLLGFPVAFIFGCIGGALTGSLFIIFKLNSIICGIITAFVAYSVCFCLLAFNSCVSVPSHLDITTIGIFGGFIALFMCLFFSTRIGLQFRIAGESPSLLMQMGMFPHIRLGALLAFGNGLAALSGALVVSVTGSVNIRLGDFKLFFVIIALVLGEGLLSVLIAIIKFTFARGEPIDKENPTNFISKVRSIASGTGAIYAVFAAILGSFLYWAIYNIVINYFNANEFDRLVLGIATAILLIVSIRVSAKYHKLSPWTFHGNL